MTTSNRFRMRRCVIAGVEAVEADSVHSFGRHTHDQFGIGVILRGAQKSASGRGPVEAGPGDMITVNPGEVHDGTPITDDGRAWCMLYLDPQLVERAHFDISDGRSGDFVFSHPVVTDRVGAKDFLSLYWEMTTTDTADQMAAESSLLLLVAAHRVEAPLRKSPAPPIARARSLIDDDPAATVTLDDLARVSGLNRFQVLRGFSRALGMTPHAYLVQRRLALSRRLIAQGLALSDAAFAGGFADQSHMTRSFVRAYGLTPGVYRQGIR
ncbi:AraC family transcriptional regulator [Pararhizobium antarcticum]|uniref:AraC family transcriptional regulator n=1 Tax=Pararhizobium antarcticum TaxID=1798805 RepID=A0A657LLV0_9HYPH|nr:AraC family transcriptional regulator [Pararhizobium antarcticum]OJF90577.1 AraC family transcriptional regulator [Pararhizobium antarcticum]OJF98653.1 AraC family transcriptional regulator [Rhizobium sp. 58]